MFNIKAQQFLEEFEYFDWNQEFKFLMSQQNESMRLLGLLTSIELKPFAVSRKTHKTSREELALVDRVEEMAVEQYDATHRHKDDTIDAKTGMKVKGDCDHEKLELWESKLKKTLKRRLTKSKERQAQQEY